MLTQSGYALIVVTNQACVGRALLSIDELVRINNELNNRLGGLVSDWFVCPHTAAVGCDCRKPAIRLFELAQQAWGFDPASTWFVADDGRDVEAATRFGCRPALVRTGKGAATAAHFPDVPLFADLCGFALWLTAHTGDVPVDS
jgi:D-glycero-D-manno-heptose 1,7-bisphosphate phosphatase